MHLNFEGLRLQIAEILETEPSELKLSTALNGNGQWDSFAMLSAVALVTKHTGKQITLSDVSNLETVTDFVGLVQKYQVS